MNAFTRVRCCEWWDVVWVFAAYMLYPAARRTLFYLKICGRPSKFLAGEREVDFSSLAVRVAGGSRNACRALWPRRPARVTLPSLKCVPVWWWRAVLPSLPWVLLFFLSFLVAGERASSRVSFVSVSRDEPSVPSVSSVSSTRCCEVRRRLP